MAHQPLSWWGLRRPSCRRRSSGVCIVSPLRTSLPWWSTQHFIANVLISLKPAGVNLTLATLALVVSWFHRLADTCNCHHHNYKGTSKQSRFFPSRPKDQNPITCLSLHVAMDYVPAFILKFRWRIIVTLHYVFGFFKYINHGRRVGSIPNFIVRQLPALHHPRLFQVLFTTHCASACHSVCFAT